MKPKSYPPLFKLALLCRGIKECKRSVLDFTTKISQTEFNLHSQLLKNNYQVIVILVIN